MRNPERSLRGKKEESQLNPALRLCLVGSHMFESEGFHNRICDDCKETSFYKSGGSGFPFQKIEGRNKKKKK